MMALPLQIWGGGGCDTQNHKSTLYTLKTRYKLFGIQIFGKISTQIHKINPSHFELYVDFNLAKYIATSPNIEQEVEILIKNLSKENQAFILRQIGRHKECFEKKQYTYSNLSKQEISEWKKIETEFLPNIFKISENLYSYKHYLLPIERFEISVFWHKHSLHILEEQTLAKIKQKDIIDVGGYVGDSTLVFEEFTDKNVYTFEPTSNYKRLLQTLKLNKTKRVIPINKALGASNAKIDISISADSYGIGSSITLDRNTGQYETIEVTTLDDFVGEYNLQVGFIKVDIEGAEMEFLKGAKETIICQKPAMLISIYHQPSDYFGIKPLIESWNLGYSFKIHQGIDYGLVVETALFCEIVE